MFGGEEDFCRRGEAEGETWKEVLQGEREDVEGVRTWLESFVPGGYSIELRETLFCSWFDLKCQSPRVTEV